MAFRHISTKSGAAEIAVPTVDDVEPYLVNLIEGLIEEHRVREDRLAKSAWDAAPDTETYLVPAGAAIATDTVTKTRLETATSDGVTYRYKPPIMPFIINPNPMPPGTMYAVARVREPQGLGDLCVQEWVKPMLLCPIPELDLDTPNPPLAIEVHWVSRLAPTTMCGNFGCGNSQKCFRCAALKSEAHTFSGEELRCRLLVLCLRSCGCTNRRLPTFEPTRVHSCSGSTG